MKASVSASPVQAQVITPQVAESEVAAEKVEIKIESPMAGLDWSFLASLH